jgi:hypothetical protein
MEYRPHVHVINVQNKHNSSCTDQWIAHLHLLTALDEERRHMSSSYYICLRTHVKKELLHQARTHRFPSNEVTQRLIYLRKMLAIRRPIQPKRSVISPQSTHCPRDVSWLSLARHFVRWSPPSLRALMASSFLFAFIVLSPDHVSAFLNRVH